jgi:very-short-patch-repair endonuclease
MRNNLDQALARISESHHGMFALHHLDELGYSREARAVRLETGRWIHVHDGVYQMAGTPLGWRSRLLGACWAGGTRALASHRSAAALWALPSGCTDIAEVICPRWKRTRHDGLVVHESLVIDDEDDRAEVDGIPCTSAARTLFDLARGLSAVMLDANIDAALRRGLVSIEDLRSTSARLVRKGRPGGRRFRDAVEARSAAAALPESVPERLLADMLVRQGLPAPRHQFVVRDRSGAFVARVDLAYPDWMVVIEYDGVEYHTSTAAHVRDSVRRDAIGDLGYGVLTATSADLKDRGARIASSIRRRRVLPACTEREVASAERE